MTALAYHRSLNAIALAAVAALVGLAPVVAQSSAYLELSTRLGGSGAEDVRDVATDADGNLYLVGSTTSSDLGGLTHAPVGADVFVAKLDPTAQRILYLEVFGGDGFDLAWGVEVDAAGNAYVAGYTASADFPAGTAFEKPVDNTDLFLVRLDPTGRLDWATVYGGAQPDGEFNGGIGIDPVNGLVYVGSRTDSTGLTAVDGFSASCPNGPCGFIVGFDPALAPDASLEYMSYVTAPVPAAQPEEDGGVLDLEVDASGNVYAFAFINPDSLIVQAGQGFQDASGDVNNNDHVLIKLDPTLSGTAQRVYSTFIGGFGDEPERGRIVALDSGVVYVGSQTGSTAATFPVLNAVQAANAGGADGYVAKIDTTLSGAASQLWTTFLGSVSDEEVNSIAVAPNGDVWVASTVAGAGSALFPQVLPLPGTPMAGVDDGAALSQISSDGTSLVFSGPSVAGAAPPSQGIVVQPSGRVVAVGSRPAGGFPLKGGLPLHTSAGNDIAVIGLEPTGDLGLTLHASATPSPAQTGSTFAIEFRVDNRGSGDASNALFTTDFPVGLVASSAGGNCSLPGSSSTCDFFEDIPRGGNAPVYYLAASTGDGGYTLNGSVSSDLVDPSPGDDADSVTITTNGVGSPAADLVLADFDAVAPSFDIGGFAVDTGAGILATPNGTFGEVMNLMHLNGVRPFHVERLLGQGEIAFGFVESGTWTPTSGDGSDLFGRDFNANADRVFAIVDADGRVELRTARAFGDGRVIATGFVPLGRPGLLSMTLGVANAEVLFDGEVVASGDPFTTDFRDALPANVGDDFVISVGFGTEDRGAAVIDVPEPDAAIGLMLGGLFVAACSALRGRMSGEN